MCNALSDTAALKAKIQVIHDREVLLIGLAVVSLAGATGTLIYRRVTRRRQICGACRKTVHASAAICPHCRTQLRVTAKSYQIDNPEEWEARWRRT